MTQCI